MEQNGTFWERGNNVDRKKAYEEAKREYLTKADVTYKILAEKYNIPESSLRKKAAKEKWKKGRHNYETRVEQKFYDRKSKIEADKLIRIGEAADKIAETIANTLEKSDKTLKKGGKLDTKAIRELASALKELSTTIRVVNGIPTPMEKCSMEIQRARFELEQKKFEAEEAERAERAEKAELGNEIIVKLEGLEEYSK